MSNAIIVIIVVVIVVIVVVSIITTTIIINIINIIIIVVMIMIIIMVVVMIIIIIIIIIIMTIIKIIWAGRDPRVASVSALRGVAGAALGLSAVAGPWVVRAAGGRRSVPGKSRVWVPLQPPLIPRGNGGIGWAAWLIGPGQGGRGPPAPGSVQAAPAGGAGE